MNQDLQVSLCNIEVASQIQVYLLNSRRGDDPHMKKAAILKDVKILAQYINEQCKNLVGKLSISEQVVEPNVIGMQSISVNTNPTPDAPGGVEFSPLRNVRKESSAPATPSNIFSDIVPETPSAANISGFDRLVAKILSPAPASAVRTPMQPTESVIPDKPIKSMPSYSLFNDDTLLDSKKTNVVVTAPEDNLLGLSINHSITFNMSRPLSPIIGNTFGTPPRRSEPARMSSGRLSGRYAGLNNAIGGGADGGEDDVFGSLTLTSVGDWAKLREYLKTQDIKMDQPLLDEPVPEFTTDAIDVKEIAGADTLNNIEGVPEKVTTMDLTTPSRAYDGNASQSAEVKLDTDVLVTPMASAPPTAVETENLYPTPGRKRLGSHPPQPATDVIKLVTPTKSISSARTLAVTPSIKASIKATASPSTQSHSVKYGTPVKGGQSAVSDSKTPSTAVVHHESSVLATPSRSVTSTPSASWGMIHTRNPSSKTPPNKMDLRKSWKMAIPSSASGKKPTGIQAKHVNLDRHAEVPDSTVKRLF